MPVAICGKFNFTLLSRNSVTLRVFEFIFSECPNYEKIIPLLLTEPPENLPLKCKVTPGQ